MGQCIIKISAFFLSLFTVNLACCQQLYFARKAFVDSAEMDRTIPALASAVAGLYQQHPGKDKLAYYSQLFRYELLAGQYDRALADIDSARRQFKEQDSLEAETVAYPIWLYAMTTGKMSGWDTTFKKAFEALFLREFESLSPGAARLAENYFFVDLGFRQANYLNQVIRLRKGTVDSISYGDARSLCFNYLNYRVYTKELPLARPLLKAVESRRYRIEDSVLITMRDGAQISATIVRSKEVSGPQPVVLKFGIYAALSEVGEAKFIATHGYTGVIADTRGKRLSPQEVEPFGHDANDAYDIIDWISRQPWCNGKVGMYGGSYLGFSTWAAVKQVHPALKTIVPIASVAPGIDFPGLYGVYWPDMLNWFHLVMNNKLTDWAGNGPDRRWDSVYLSWYRSGRAFAALDTMEGRPNAIFHRFLRHPSMDSFWTGKIPYKEEYAAIRIPVLTITGYYDDDQRGAMYYFDQHYSYNAHPEHYLLIGPYDHYGAQGYPLDPLPVIEGYAVDTVARIKIMAVVFKWFDHVLKDSARPALLADTINFEVMGANRWRHVPSLKQMNNDSITLYLSNRPSGPGYKLLRHPSGKNVRIRQVVDLAARNDSVNNESYFINGESPQIIDSSLRQGSYVEFESDPFTQGFDVNGSFIARLNMIINKGDMDLSINLYEQQPDGRYFQLSNNVARCSWLKDPGRRQLLTPGVRQTIGFDNTWFTSKHLIPGSRIVVLIGVNKNHNWEVNYGTGKEVNQESLKDADAPLQIQWLTNGSYIKLPVWD